MRSGRCVHLLQSIAVLATLPLTGCCVLSIESPFKSEDIFFSSDLAGTWVSRKVPGAHTTAGETWRFGRRKPLESEEDPRLYDVVGTIDHNKQRFLAVLGRLGDRVFLDLLPDGGDSEPNGRNFGLVGVHSLTRITLKPREMRIEFISESKTASIPSCSGCPELKLPTVVHYADFSNGFGVFGSPATSAVLLTAPGPAFREFLVKAAPDDRIFELYGEFQRAR